VFARSDASAAVNTNRGVNFYDILAFNRVNGANFNASRASAAAAGTARSAFAVFPAAF